RLSSAAIGLPGAPAHTAHSADDDVVDLHVKDPAGPGRAAPGTASATRSSSCRWPSDLIVVAQVSVVTRGVPPGRGARGWGSTRRAYHRLRAHAILTPASRRDRWAWCPLGRVRKHALRQRLV